MKALMIATDMIVAITYFQHEQYNIMEIMVVSSTRHDSSKDIRGTITASQVNLSPTNFPTLVHVHDDRTERKEEPILAFNSLTQRQQQWMLIFVVEKSHNPSTHNDTIYTLRSSAGPERLVKAVSVAPALPYPVMEDGVVQD